MKKRMLLIALMMGIVVTGCDKQGNTDVPKIEISDVDQETEKEETSEKNEETDETEVPKEEGFSFAELANVEFMFSSGAGGWRTVLHVGEDGSFWGEYSDSEMGSVGELYPNGTVYLSEFEGEFTKPVKVNDYTYSVGIADIEYKKKPGTEEIIDQMLWIYSTAAGIEEANSLLLYLPGTPLEELPEEYLEWVQMAVLDEDTKVLPFYGFYNEKDQKGFSSYEVMSPMDELLNIAENNAKAITDSLENEDLNQAELNEKSAELYKVWDKLLNDFWAELKGSLPKDEYETLLNEQRAWIKEKEAAVEKAGAEYAGGSAEPMARNMKAASMTEERVYELYKLLK